MHHKRGATPALSHLTIEYCRRYRKLILACDMDETLLTESQYESGIILRPKVIQMLRSIRGNFELCLVTYSTRDRARSILSRRLDPTGRLFGQRVLCREDILPMFNTKLEAFMACLPRINSKEELGGDQDVNLSVRGLVDGGTLSCLTETCCSNSSFGDSYNLSSGSSHKGGMHRYSACCRGNSNKSPLRETSESNKKIKNRMLRRPSVLQYVLALDDIPAAWSNHPSCLPVRPFTLDRSPGYLERGVPRARLLKSEGMYVVSLWKFLLRLHTFIFRQNIHLSTPLPTPVGSRITSIILLTDETHRRESSHPGNAGAGNKNTSGISNNGLSVLRVMSRVRRKILSFSRFQQLVHEDPLMLLEFIEDENSEKLVDEVIMTLESGGEPKAACGSDSSARMGCIEAEHYSRDPRRPTCTVKMMPGQIRESNPYNSLQSSHSCLRIVPMLAEVRN